MNESTKLQWFDAVLHSLTGEVQRFIMCILSVYRVPGGLDPQKDCHSASDSKEHHMVAPVVCYLKTVGSRWLYHVMKVLQFSRLVPLKIVRKAEMFHW